MQVGVHEVVGEEHLQIDLRALAHDVLADDGTEVGVDAVGDAGGELERLDENGGGDERVLRNWERDALTALEEVNEPHQVARLGIQHHLERGAEPLGLSTKAAAGAVDGVGGVGVFAVVYGF